MKSKGCKTIFFIFLICVICLSGAIGCNYLKHENMKKVKITKDKEKLSVNKNTEKKSELNGINNIVFFGKDAQNEEESTRSDSIIIVTIDGIHKKIKMTSLMRDTYVEIEGYGKTKLNHAYSYGGPELSIKTINKNFGLDIKDFVAVDFYEFADIIDELDGVTVDIKKDEIKPLNTCIRGIENLRKTAIDKIYEPGTYTLNGDQAVAYCRVRDTAGGDYERTERQRFVLSQLFNKMKNMNKKDFIKIVPNLACKVETSMGYSQIMKLGIQVFTSDINVIEQKRFPLDEHSYGQFIHEIWYLITDIDATKEEINKFIYN